MLWDRQDKKMYPLKYYNYDETSGREYWKHGNCNLWLEDGIALDVFIILPMSGSIMKYIKGIHKPKIDGGKK